LLDHKNWTKKRIRLETAMNHPKPWLRYITADKISDKTLPLDGMKVRNDAQEKLGRVDGLIVDSESGRPYYIVVDAGGWFKSKEFLAPIGQVHLDSDKDSLVLSLSKEQINRFPGFDTGEFDELTDGDIKRINDQICEVYEPGATYAADEPYSSAWDRSQYATPTWWRERSWSDDEEIRAEGSDTSPHFDRRAQPGIVLGLETGGERTSIGDTTEDENEKRRDAEETVAKGNR
jgi:PRC-barrel domain